MSATYTIFSPISPAEMLDVERACEQAIEKYFDEHPDCEDEHGEIGAGGILPTPEEVKEAYHRYGVPLPAAVLERLSRCRSAFTIDRPGDIDVVGGLQVSVLRFVLERTGEGLVLLNDYPFEGSERLLARLKKRRGAPGFGARAAAARPAPVRTRKAKPGEVRALGILGVLHAAFSDPDLAVDVKAALASVDEAARAYAALLVEEGPLPDAEAAQALGLGPADFATAAEALDEALAPFRP